MVCNKCGGMCRPEYETCWTCKNKERAENPQEQPAQNNVKKEKDDWKEGAIKGHIQKIIHEYALKFAKTEEEYWVITEKVKPVFEKKLRE